MFKSQWIQCLNYCTSFCLFCNLVSHRAGVVAEQWIRYSLNGRYSLVSLWPWTHKKTLCKLFHFSFSLIVYGFVLKIIWNILDQRSQKVVCCDPPSWEALASAHLRVWGDGEGSNRIPRTVLLSWTKGLVLDSALAVLSSWVCKDAGLPKLPNACKTLSRPTSSFMLANTPRAIVLQRVSGTSPFGNSQSSSAILAIALLPLPLPPLPTLSVSQLSHSFGITVLDTWTM